MGRKADMRMQMMRIRDDGMKREMKRATLFKDRRDINAKV